VRNNHGPFEQLTVTGQRYNWIEIVSEAIKKVHDGLKKAPPEPEKQPTRLTLSITSAPAPTADDIETMYQTSKDNRDIVVEWIWPEEALNKTFELIVIYPYIKNRDFWDYEQRDDPTWTLSQKKGQGNPVIWHYKTSDIILVTEIVRMVRANEADQIPTTKQQDVVVATVIPTPIFSEYLIDPNQRIQQAIADGLQEVAKVLYALAARFFTGKVEFTNKKQIAQIFCERGTPVHAFYSGTTGDAVVREAISWQVAKTSYVADERVSQRTVTRHMQFLVREGLALAEQKKFLAKCQLTYESITSKIDYPEPQLRSLINDFEKKLYDRSDGKTKISDIIRDLTMESWEWAPILCNLVTKRLIEIKPPLLKRPLGLQIMPDTANDSASKLHRIYSQQTGLLSYHALILFMQREYFHFRDHNTPLSLIVFDIQLIASGDTKSHWLSSQVATAVGRKIGFAKRPLDVFAHFESFEYALLLPNTDLKQATLVGKQIMQMLTETALSDDPDLAAAGKIVAHCGVAGLPNHGSDLECLLQSARFAKHQAKQLRLPLVIGQHKDEYESTDDVQAISGLRDAAPVEAAAAARPEALSVQLGDVLIRAGLVSPDHLALAHQLISRMPVPLPIGRVLAMEGHIREDTVDSAIKMMPLINTRKMSIDQAIKALHLIGNHSLDYESALKRLGRGPKPAKVNPLVKLLKDADILYDKDLKKSIRENANTGLPIGYILVSMGALTRPMLHALLFTAAQVQSHNMTRADGVKVVCDMAHNSASLEQALQNLGANIEPQFDLAELLYTGGILTEMQYTSVCEIRLVERKAIADVLRESGFMREPIATIASQLLEAVSTDKLSQDHAAKLLKNVKNATTVPNISELISELEQRQRPNAAAEVDRVELLKAAGYVNDEQLQFLDTVATSQQKSLLRTLFTAGIIDQPTLDATGWAKRTIEAGDLDTEQAIILLKYCKDQKVTFDHAVDLFSWRPGS